MWWQFGTELYCEENCQISIWSDDGGYPHIRTCTHIYPHIRTYTHIYPHTVYPHIPTYTHIYPHITTYTHIITYTHIDVHIPTYTYLASLPMEEVKGWRGPSLYSPACVAVATWLNFYAGKFRCPANIYHLSNQSCILQGSIFIGGESLF